MKNPLYADQGVPSLMEAKASSVTSNRRTSFTQSPALKLGSTSLENHIGSVLVLTEGGDVLYATESMRDRLNEIAAAPLDEPSIPQEISLICHMLKQCRGKFPSQNWAIEFDIFTKNAVALRIRSRWLKLENLDQPSILIIMEDRQQMVQDIVLDEAQDWGLTPREREVWLLHQDGYTYNQIAEKLFISMNTVKKHMRSIHAKRRVHEN